MTSASSGTALTVARSGQAFVTRPPLESVSISTDLVLLSDPESLAAESIRQLRARIVAQHLSRGRRALAFCSPHAESGCSFIAANVAVGFAQLGMRVLLINADMRGAGLDTMFGTAGMGPGLLQLLSGEEVRADSIVQFEVLPSLSLVTSGGRSASAPELLSTARFEDFFNRCLREFDLTIIDSPPANLYAEGQQIAAVAGYAVIVGRAHRTYVNDVSELSRQLVADRVSVVGTILNNG